MVIKPFKYQIGENINMYQLKNYDPNPKTCYLISIEFFRKTEFTNSYITAEIRNQIR